MITGGEAPIFVSVGNDANDKEIAIALQEAEKMNRVEKLNKAVDSPEVWKKVSY